MDLSKETLTLLKTHDKQGKCQQFLAQINEAYQAVLQLPFTDDSTNEPIKLIGNGQCGLNQLVSLKNQYIKAYDTLLDIIKQKFPEKLVDEHKKSPKELLIVIPFLDFYFSLDQNAQAQTHWEALYKTATTRDLKNNLTELQQFTNSFQETLSLPNTSLSELSHTKALGVLKFFIISALKTTLTSKTFDSINSENSNDPRNSIGGKLTSFFFEKAYSQLKEIYMFYNNLPKKNTNAPTELGPKSSTNLIPQVKHSNNPSNLSNQLRCDQYSNGRVFDYLLTLACYMLMLPECFVNNACKLLVAITAIGSVVTAVFYPTASEAIIPTSTEKNKISPTS